MSFLNCWITGPFKYRFLLRGFVVQDIQGRFAGSMGGVLWAVIAPLANLLVLAFVFSVIMKIRVIAVETGTDSFVVFLLSGLLPWMAFSEAISRSTTLLFERANLITKVAFPVQILPVAGGLAPFILNGVGLGLFLVFLLLKGEASIFWLWLPVVVSLHFLFTLGLVSFFSALSVFFRDIQQIMGVILALWMYLTPILYPLSMVPEKYQKFMLLNPMYPFIQLYRSVILRQQVSWEMVTLVCMLTVVSYLGGGWFFMRIKHAFGDVL